MENQSFSCPNPSCGKAFPNPIKAKNVNSKNAKVYDACPYCLTEITVEASTISAVLRDEPRPEAGTEPKGALPTKEEKRNQAVPKVQGCAYHFGYLSQRSTKEMIPEDCMTCESIVKCMLKVVNG